MQNWNQWQVPAGTVTTPMPPTPAGFTAPGADPMAMMQSYMQYYNQPAPSGYTAEQWAAAQQQNWAQWQQWQQQFQQWQAQYGEKYQETMKQLSAQGLSLPNVTQAPPLPSSQPPPPLPKEDNSRPPLPPDNNNPYQYANIPPPHQNNLPLFPAKSQSGDYNSGNTQTYTQAPPLPPGQPPPPCPNPQEPPRVSSLGEKRGNNEPVDFGSAKKTKVEDEELTEAEKTFDAQFKQWEEQFNKWKQQNANHPDKTQYKQYEAKWTSWREKLIERREQMRKKREQQKQTTKAEPEKNKNIPGGDKILNILSSSENQGLINNLLGIGKTLGLTGKQEAGRPSTSAGNTSTAPQLQPPSTSQPTAMIAPTMTSDMNQAAWAAQQWAAQYNATMGAQNYSGFQFVAGMAPPPTVAGQTTQPAGNNFSQPPPNLPNPGMNFSLPPPGFGASDSRQTPASGIKPNQRNMHERPPSLFGPDGDKRDGFSGGEQFPQSKDHFQSADNSSDRGGDRFSLNDRGGPGNQFPSPNYRFGRDTQNNEFGGSDRGGGNQFGSDNERFNQAAKQFGGNRSGEPANERSGSGNQFRLENDSFGPRSFRQDNDVFGKSDERDSGNNRFARDNNSFAPSSDRFGPNDRAGLGINRLGRNEGNSGPGNDRFGLSNDHLGSDTDRFSSSIDRFGSNTINDQFGPGSKDRFGPEKDRFGSGNLLGNNNDRLSSGNERFDSGNSRFGSGSGKDTINRSNRDPFNDSFGPGNDRFTRSDRPNIPDLFDSKDHSYMNDNRRDSFGDNARGGVNRSVRPFEASDSIAPELKKLMEKRRAAMDVFKPRDNVFSTVKQDNIGSLSESFKKITGDLPYTSRNPGDAGPKSLLGLGLRGPDNFSSRGPGDFGPRGPDSLISRGPGDLGLRGPDSLMSRGPGDIGHRGPDISISRGPGDFGPRGPGPFQGNNSFGQQPPRGMNFGDFGPPGPDRFRPRGEFSSPGNEFGPSRGQGNFGPRGRGDFEFGPKDDRTMADQSSNLASHHRDGPGNMGQPQGFDKRDNDRPKDEQAEVPVQSSAGEHGENALKRDDKPASESSLKNILPLERPPWMDAQFSEQNLNDTVDDGKAKPVHQDNSVEIEPENCDKANNSEAGKSNLSVTDKPASENNEQGSNNQNQNQQASENQKPGLPLAEKDNSGKDQNTLPFMGENDPKPEDLNMEPPPDLPNLGPITETPNSSAFRSNILDSDRPPRSITQRGSNSPYFDASGPGPAAFRLGGPNFEQFGPRGPHGNRFEPRAPNDRQFGPRNPNDHPFGPRGPAFGQRGPNDSQFGPRSLNEGHLGPRGLGDGQFGARGPAPFGPKDVYDTPMNMPAQRALDDGLLGPRPAEEQFGPMGRGFPPPRGPSSGQFGQRPLNNPPFSMLRGPHDGQFRPRGPNEGPQGPNNGQKPAIPSLLGLQFDKQPNFDPPNMPGNTLNPANKDFMPNGMNMEESKLGDGRRPFGENEHPDHKLPFPLDQRPFGSGSQIPPGRLMGPDQRPPFVQGVPEQRSPFERDAPGDAGQRSPFVQGGPASNEPRPLLRQGGSSMNSPHSQGSLDQRSPFMQSGPRGLEENLSMAQGTFDQRIDPNRLEQRHQFGPGGQGNMDQKMVRGRDQRSDFDTNLRENDQQSQFSNTRKGMNDSLPGSRDNSQFDSGFYDKSRDLNDRRRPQRSSAIEEFCVGKQFNYNHGGGAMDKNISEIIPGKVIDYGHATKVIVHEYITPAQSFDYGHGHLKPEVPEHEVVPQRDFRHWEDTEQSLKEYDDRLRLHAREHDWQSRAKLKDNYKFERPNSREREPSRVDRRSYECDDRRLMELRESRARRGRDIKEERKERERDRERARDDRDREYARDSDREERPRKDGSDNRDKNQERGERSERNDRMKTDQNKEYNREDDRSKGNISRQEYQNKSNANTSTQEPSTSEAKNDSTETTSKKMELPRTPNYTMVDDILFQPGRQTRPPKIVIILRGPPGSGKSFVAKLIKDKEVEQGGSAPRILSLDDYFLVEKEKETKDDNGKRVVVKEMVYEYEEAMEQSYLASLIKAFKKNITDGYFNFIILDCINEKISDYEEMWSFAKTKGFQVYVCEMEMDVHICMKRNIHNRTEDEINKIVDYFEPTPNHHLKLDVNAMLQEEAIDEVHMEDSQQSPEETAAQVNEDSQDSQEDKVGVSKWEQMDADNKLDRLDGLAKKKTESRPQTMEDFLQVPDYYNMEDTSGKKRVRWADLEERKEQEKLRAVGFVVGHTNWDRMMDPTKGQSALTRTKYI